MRFAELFAGAGGLSMGLERAGHECVWHAEWNEQARCVLSYRWPQVPLYGDVTTLDGRELTAMHGPIDLLSGGSPCQDLSVAGKRAGLDGSRSSLFFEQMRLWDETGADLCLWENVDGARSSNEGKDFGLVLRAFVGAAVPVPSDGWRSAGVAAGPRGVAAWRVLDAQFFGVPQRRRRVFVLGTRTGSVDPAEILSLAESVRGDSPASREAGEGAAVSAPTSVDTTLVGNGDAHSGFRDAEGVVVAFDWRVGTGDPCPSESVVPCLNAITDHAAVMVADEWERCAVCNVPRWGHGTEEPFVINNDSRAAWSEMAAPLRSGERSAPSVLAGIPRRLMPIECERLMSWPDDHTLVLGPNGKLLSDAARYRLCGNGVASVHTHWIGWRLALVKAESFGGSASPGGAA